MQTNTSGYGTEMGRSDTLESLPNENGSIASQVEQSNGLIETQGKLEEVNLVSSFH